MESTNESTELQRHILMPLLHLHCVILLQSSESQNCGLNVSGGGGTPYSDLTGLQTIKKDGKVMRPMNAFMLWAKGYRRELIAKG